MEQKEALLQSVLDKTMQTGRDHGPIIRVNRLQIPLTAKGLAGPHGTLSVLAQTMQALAREKLQTFLLLKERVWKVRGHSGTRRRLVEDS